MTDWERSAPSTLSCTLLKANAFRVTEVYKAGAPIPTRVGLDAPCDIPDLQQADNDVNCLGEVAALLGSTAASTQAPPPDSTLLGCLSLLCRAQTG